MFCFYIDCSFTDSIWRMPLKKRKIYVSEKPIGGRAKRSCLKGKSVSQPHHSALPGPSTHPVGHLHVGEEASSSHYEDTAYSKAKKKELSVWESLKPELLRLALESSAPSTNTCCICKTQADFLCLECSTTAVFCENCVKASHKNSLHRPEKWNVSTFSYLYMFSLLSFCVV